MPASAVKTILCALTAISVAAALTGAPRGAAAMGGGPGGRYDSNGYPSRPIGMQGSPQINERRAAAVQPSGAGPDRVRGDGRVIELHGPRIPGRERGPGGMDEARDGYGPPPHFGAAPGGPPAPLGEDFRGRVIYGDDGAPEIGNGGFGHGHEPPLDPSHLDHRFMVGPVADEARVDWAPDFWLTPHLYGDHDSQPCARRDVYGDIYQAC